MEKRPYIANTTKELETFFKQNQNNITVLKNLRKELMHRNRKAALLLLAKVEQRIEKLDTDANVPHEPEQMNLLNFPPVKKDEEKEELPLHVPDQHSVGLPITTHTQVILNNHEIKTEISEKKYIFKDFLELIFMLIFIFIILSIFNGIEEGFYGTLYLVFGFLPCALLGCGVGVFIDKKTDNSFLAVICGLLTGFTICYPWKNFLDFLIDFF